MSIAVRLLEVRKKAGLTQADFAQSLGTSLRSYISYEQSKREVPLSLLVKIVESHGTSLEWLALGKGAENRELLDHRIAKATVLVGRMLMQANALVDDEVRGKLIAHATDFLGSANANDESTLELVLLGALTKLRNKP